VAGALERDDWGLDRIEEILAGSAAEAGEDSALRTLRELTAASTPTKEALAKAAQDLRTAAERLRSASGTVAARSRDLADVLDHALRFHERHGDGDCPVCGRAGAMNAAWHAEKARETKELRDAARAVETAQRQATEARAQALGAMSDMTCMMSERPSKLNGRLKGRETRFTPAVGARC
jgi:hypothetical protein